MNPTFAPVAKGDDSVSGRTVVNDHHSGLNGTAVSRVIRPESLVQLSAVINSAGATRMQLSIAGGRHAMGGQQFLQNGILLDMTTLDHVLEFDGATGQVRIEAGATWPRLLERLEHLQKDSSPFWTFSQKQSGADHLTMGGALSANIHGRGLRLRPFVQDIVSFDLMNTAGRLIHCSRTENPELFLLAIGGYGLFGVVYSVTLHLVKRVKLRRQVRIKVVDELVPNFDQAITNGCAYGDFQFAIDPGSDDFLRRGIFATYEPVPDETPIPGRQRNISPEQWEHLLELAHIDKTRAFHEYSEYYQSTRGQIYWSDTHQLSYYPEGYHQRLDQKLNACCASSEMITELYVPRERLNTFMRAVRGPAREMGWNIIYGTIRLIERDEETFLAWARESWACVILNLCVQHSPGGMDSARRAFRTLIQIAIDHGGGYYLTYHKWATPEQLLACYPQFPDFLRKKREYDPEEMFVSNWHHHYGTMVSGTGNANKLP